MPKNRLQLTLKLLPNLQPLRTLSPIQKVRKSVIFHSVVIHTRDTSLWPCIHTGNSQLLVPPDLKRQPDKPITGLPTFMHITMLDDLHPSMSYFAINSPPLRGPQLWKAMLRHCTNDSNCGVVLTRAKRDKRLYKNILLRQVCFHLLKKSYCFSSQTLPLTSLALYSSFIP